MKKIKYLLFTLLLFLVTSSVSAASYYGITSAGVNVRSEPKTGSSVFTVTGVGATYNMPNNTAYPDQGGCDGNPWYQIYYNGSNTGYVCSKYLTVYEKITSADINRAPANDYEVYLQSLGFPSTYWTYLTNVHNAHPNWTFAAAITNLDFQTSINVESVPGMSLIDSSYEGYRSTDGASYNYLTDTFKALEGSNWYAASSDVVAYYMDPRNFLNDSSIFMFEELGYDNTYQTESGVRAVFGTSYLSSYVATFMNAGATYHVNPIYLAARVRQEVGLTQGTAMKGMSFTYNNKTYSNLYNAYNIGATTGSNPVLKGLVWANGGENGTSTSYGRPWRSIEATIKGGAEFIAASYIGKGQNTLYYQRFNVSPTSAYSKYSHQYMTNIRAVASEAISSYSSYKNMEMLDSSFKFVIPVYKDMGYQRGLPATGNPNNHLNNLTVNGNTVNGFAHDNYAYNYYVAEGVSSISIGASTINSKARVENTGNISLTGATTPIQVKVTAENGAVCTYTINVIKTNGATLSPADLINSAPVKNDGSNIYGLSVGMNTNTLINMVNSVSASASVSITNSSNQAKNGVLATGDIIYINSNGVTKGYNIVIFGDVSGDGEITVLDLLKVQKQILGTSKLSGPYYLAADVSHDGAVTVLDLLKVQKNILGTSTITQ